ncbi:MAG TPA: non-homologous end-joining DNA ligase, partial [Planctomycetota bacterium]|nr:non-homologous end-joining DNA ligase [Planctomycetota bacterium]
MLATLVEEPFERPGWVFEEKYDGIRIVTRRKGGRVELHTRNLIDRTRDFPGIVRELEALPGGDFTLDGEVVTFDAEGVSRFQMFDSRRAVYAVFDCLERDGVRLMKRPLGERRRAVEELLAGRHPHLMVARRLEGGRAAYRLAQREGWEGIVAKDEASVYEPGKRSRAWLKVKVVKESEFVIGGYTPPAGSRKHLGALLVGLYERGKLRYTGKVGSGFTVRALADLHGRLGKIEVPETPFVNGPRYRKAIWVEPRLVAQLRFAEWTGDGRLR